MEIGSGETYSLYLQGTAINYVESLILGNWVDCGCGAG